MQSEREQTLVTGICAFIIGFSFTVWTRKNTERSNRMLTKFVSIGSYSPEIRTFGTLITCTKVFSLITAKIFDHAPKKILYLEIFDSVPRYLRLRT